MMVTKFGIQIDTNNFTEEDLQVFCRILEEIHQKRQKQEQGAANVQQYPSKALMTHCEIFDSTGLLPKDQTSNLNSMNDAINSKRYSPSVCKMESSKLQQEIFKYSGVCRSPSFKQRNIPITYKANDEEFQRLSVKEKVVWFENNKRSRIRNEFNVNRHVVEKSKGTENYVKRLRDLWETRLNTSLYSNESSFLLKREKKTNLSLDSKLCKETKKLIHCDKIVLNNWRKQISLKNITAKKTHLHSQSSAQLKPIETFNVTLRKIDEDYTLFKEKKRQNISNDFNEESNCLHKSLQVNSKLCEKRPYHILRSTLLPIEFMAPPKKIRRLDSLHALKHNRQSTFVQNSQPNCSQYNDRVGLHNKAKDNLFDETLISKFKNIILFDNTSKQKTTESTRFNTYESNSTKLNIAETDNDSYINSNTALNFDLDSFEGYLESQSSIDLCSTNSEKSFVKRAAHKKSIYHCLKRKKKQELNKGGTVTLNWTSDSDTELETFQTNIPAFELHHNKKNIICHGLKCWCAHADIIISDEMTNHKFPIRSDKSFRHDFYSPTAMSTPTSIQTNVYSDYDKSFKRSDIQMLSKCTHEICSECKYNVEDNTFIDQGFETGSNDTQSPIRYKKSDVSIENQNKYYAMCSTPDPGSARRLQRNLLNSVSPIREINVNNAKNQSSVTNTSEFWITFGNYTLSFKIHHCPWERLLLLRKAFVQEHTVENMGINFGIDKQIFPLHSKSILLIQELVQRLCSKDNVNNSYYWFSKGNVWLPFKGPVISTARIRRIFTCLQELRQQDEDSNCLTLGIDNYVFFTNHRKQTNSSKSGDSN